ncbi:MAG: Nif3-like dinuclear metal center hexameric protein [Desulfobacter sp.]|nr:Nif3-like dinuclear metal center hexameric protein [Desulfobacter sp.]WDP88073.1 MAG: Nif3-like dinuclear metal center hexameric protein [Desulfobacter sp.]
MPCVKNIIGVLNQIAPFELAETWDNSGLQAGDPSWPVHKIMVGLDVTLAGLKAAEKLNCDMFISHHPLVMTPEKSIDFGRMPGAAVCFCAQKKIAVVSAHTNLDKAHDGLNDYFARVINIPCDSPFYADDAKDIQEPFRTGLGRIGVLDNPISVGQLADQIKKRLNIPALRVAGDMDKMVRSIALCTGSGGSLTSFFLDSSAEVYITGDLKYHEARDIETRGKTAIDVGHFASEHIVVDLLKNHLDRALTARGDKIKIYGFNKEKDPFKII